MTVFEAKKIFRKMFSCLSILAVFLLAFTTSPASAELTLESVYPNQGVLGQDLAVTLKGTGFDENTKVSMALDVGNKKAIIGSVDTPGNAQGIPVVGSTAYVADNGAGDVKEAIEATEKIGKYVPRNINFPFDNKKDVAGHKERK